MEQETEPKLLRHFSRKEELCWLNKIRDVKMNRDLNLSEMTGARKSVRQLIMIEAGEYLGYRSIPAGKILGKRYTIDKSIA